MNIGTAAAHSGVPAKTIRYYESVGLIQPADRTASGYRVYGEQDVETLRFVQRARSLGFSVEDVGSLLALWRDRSRTSAEVKALARHRVEDIDRKITELTEMRETLLHLMERCKGDERPECPILQGLAGKTA
ncbi:Cu(I)-responsive transcriptional regulator [Pelagibius marinus]|uniref:Cu(I)-responsive transcriptional regulator n=1 Tax=Pelagibius marinus TaxID=2762760 RepID=UPI0018724141|nr:Cu(I)-responsive transcriptional regulator [Pelagibius marinus]